MRTTRLISAYLPSDTLYTNQCGYACSDHCVYFCMSVESIAHTIRSVSWEDKGFPAVSIDESGPNDSQLNPYYHSTQDTIDKLDFTKAAEFVKVSLNDCILLLSALTYFV